MSASPDRLQFGVNLYPHQWPDAARIEELGYDSVWTSEHIFFHFPTFDALTILAAVAATTDRIRLGTAVLLLPLRPAALAAKEITSVDVISGGRLTLGIGVGGEYPKEFQAVGVPVNQRGARTDEAIQLLRKLWTEDNVSFEGRFTKLDGVTLQPKPAQPGGPPLWIAGRSQAAIRRAGRHGDGYLPYLFSPERFRDSLAQVRQVAEEAGRDPASVSISLKRSLHFTDIGLGEGASVRSGGAIIGTSQEIIDDVYYCRELGIDQLTYDFRVERLPDCIKVMEHLADKVLPVARRLG
jgi:probable F420-dependent oxidoreductase